MKKLILLYFLHIWLVAFNYLSANTDNPITFTHINIDKGLSQSTVFSIAQDRQGNMWFATFDGVNKYDGYSFKVYRHETDNSQSIANDIARIIKSDANGQIWIGTHAGLSFYDD